MARDSMRRVAVSALTPAASRASINFVFGLIGTWPTGADGQGYSIVLRAPETNPDHALPLNWRVSARPGGTPGGADTLPLPANPLADSDANGLCDLIDYAMGNNLGLIHFKNIKKDAQSPEVLHAIQELRSVFPYELPNASEDHQPFTIHKARLTGYPDETKPVLRGQP